MIQPGNNLTAICSIQTPILNALDSDACWAPANDLCLLRWLSRAKLPSLLQLDSLLLVGTTQKTVVNHCGSRSPGEQLQAAG